MRQQRWIPVALLLIWAVAAHADWPSGGRLMTPIPVPNDSYHAGHVGADGAGGAIVHWTRSTYNPIDLYSANTQYAQRVTEAGEVAPGWPAYGVPIASDNIFTGPIYSSRLLGLFPDATGGYFLPFVTWHYIVEPLTTFELKRLGSDGSVQTLVNGLPFGVFWVHDAAADVDGAGGLVVVASQLTYAPPGNPHPPEHLFVQRLGANGFPTWPAGNGAPGPVLIPSGQQLLDPGSLAVVSDGAGGLYAAWRDGRDATGGPGGTLDPDLYAQHVLADGSIDPAWPAGGAPVCTAAGSPESPRLVLAGPGSVIVSWRDHRGPQPQIHAAGLVTGGALATGCPADGRPIGDPDADVTLLQLLSDGAGGALLLRGARTALPYTGRTYCHRIQPDGLPSPGWPLGGVPLGAGSAPYAVADMSGDGAAGAYVLFWEGNGPGLPRGLFALHLLADGSPAPGWSPGGALLSETGSPSFSVATTGSAIAAWSDTRHPEGSTVYTHLLGPTGPVAIAVSLERAEARDGAADLSWMVSDGVGLLATLWRRTETGDWQPIAGLSPDGTGRIEYLDRAVAPGTRYGYRLSYEETGSTWYTSDVWIDIPPRAAFSLDPPRPTLVEGRLELAYTLPGDGAARLELVDVSGRRRLARDLGAPGSGRHAVILPEARSLSPGLYFARLIHGGQARQQRIIIVR